MSLSLRKALKQIQRAALKKKTCNVHIASSLFSIIHKATFMSEDVDQILSSSGNMENNEEEMCKMPPCLLV